MSHVVLSHHQSAPGGQIFVRVLQKFAGVGDGAQDVGAEETTKLPQRRKIAGIAHNKLDSLSVLGNRHRKQIAHRMSVSSCLNTVPLYIGCVCAELVQLYTNLMIV